MADNALTGSNVPVATDKVTYSGDADQNVQLMRPVLVTGAEGSKTVVDLPGDATNGLDVDVTRVKPDGTNTMPSGDAVGRAIFVKPTDGTTVPDVSTAGADGNSNTSNRLSVSSRSQVFNGTTWDRQRGDTNGTYTVGNVAHDAADAGNPVKVGAKAIAHGTNPTAVAAADRTDLYANRAGILFTIGGHPNVITSSARVTTAQTNAAIIAGTIATGTKVVVTRITVTLSNATTVNVGCKIGFGTASVPADSTTGAAGVLADHDGIPPGGGFTIGDGSGIIGIGADDEELRLTSDVPTDGALTVTVTYYTIES